MVGLTELAANVRACRLCEAELAHGVRPVLQVSSAAPILVAAQAPGRRVHETGIPFNDPSGDRLRDWMGIDRATFYNPDRLAILPMGFCYPGTGKSGDLPPIPRCAATWRQSLLDELGQLRLTLVIGQYAQRWHLGATGNNLTETVRHWHEYAPNIIPLPHPSPRNNIWIKKNPWFEQELVPVLQDQVRQVLSSRAQ
jgi:uracil-DNA glycosylase